MLKELKTIFESIDKDVLTEDTLNSISDMIEEKVNQKVDERVTLEVESALQTQNDKFKKVTQEALKRIDVDHTTKAKMLVNHLKEDSNNKMMTIHNRYKKLISETAVNHRDSLVESISDFLDMYIEESLPKELVESAAKNTVAMKSIEEARKILGVDEKFMKDNVKEALIDGKMKMDSLLKENKELKMKKVVFESKRILAEKTENLPANVTRFVKARLSGKSPQFIEENFQYVIDMFKRQERSEKKAALLSERKNSNVDRNRVADELTKPITENNQGNINPDNPLENVYLEGLSYKK